MGGITGIVNSLSNKETYHRYAKAFITILKYSPMAVQRFCQGDAQVLTLQPHPIEEHPNGKQFNVTTEHEFNRLHRLCSDLHRAETWNGRHLQLYIYRCRSSEIPPWDAWLTWKKDGDREEKLLCSRETPMEIDMTHFFVSR